MNMYMRLQEYVHAAKNIFSLICHIYFRKGINLIETDEKCKYRYMKRKKIKKANM